MKSGVASRNVVLVGFMGTGKSSVGRLVAARLGFQFIDTDARIIQETGQSIADLFRVRGEGFFRACEARVLDALQTTNSAVVATGGGIVVPPENRPRLAQLGFVVALTADPETILERVSRTTKRPLLQTADPRATITELLSVRTALYQATAHYIVNTTGRSHSEVADDVIASARAFLVEPTS